MEIKTNQFVFFLLFLAFTSAPKAESLETVCDHPAEFLARSTELRRLHAAFDAPAERRIFTEVHYYPKDPHLTIGMGHWTYQHISTLFEKLKQNKSIWDMVINSWYSLLTPTMWNVFAADTGVSEQSPQAFEQGLSKLLCLNQRSTCLAQVFTPWTRKKNEDFNRDNNWFRAGWKVVGRLRPVTEIQAQYWLEALVLPSESEALKVGASTFGGVASLASALSTSTATSQQVAKRVQATKEVPREMRPVQVEIDDERLLADWRSVIAWNEYVRIKKDIRPRMRAIWPAYFEKSWGKMPSVPGNLRSIRHTGCYMASGNFEREAQFELASPPSCNAGVPKAEATDSVRKFPHGDQPQR
jgi:hypothetical protein